jgi:hypothetical protein
MTPSGIEPATFRFVAQQLNHCATAVPIRTRYLRNNSIDIAQCKSSIRVTARRVSFPPARGAVACDRRRASTSTPCCEEEPPANAGRTLTAREDPSADTVPPAYQPQDAQFNVDRCTDVFRVSSASSDRCFSLSCCVLFTDSGGLPEINQTHSGLKPRNFPVCSWCRVRGASV